jgi:Tfp pilus assembly protein PilV
VAPATSITNIGRAHTRRGFRARVARRRGFTLAEAMIASVVLAAASLGVATSIGASYQQDQSVQQMSTAIALSRELMEEISAKPFDDPNGTSALGPESGETSRALYDNVDDYHNYSDTTDTSATGAMKNLANTSLTLGDGQIFTRSVSVQYRRTPSGSSAASGDFAVVTVTVTDPTGRTLTTSRLFARNTWVLP